MKTIERYVFNAFFSSFILAFLILSFVLTIGLMVQIVQYILQGLPIDLVGEFATVSFPETLQWTIPLSLLVSSILVFSRLSADSEVAAMRACGINIFSVMRWPLLFGLCCTILSLYVNNEVVPRGHEIRRNLARRISVGAGLELLEPGKVINDFPKVKIYFEEKEGNWLKDIVVLDYSNPKIDRLIIAGKALVSSEGRDILFDLRDMTVDPLDENHPGMARAARFQYRMKGALKNSKYKPKEKDLTLIPYVDKDGMQRKSIIQVIGDMKKEIKSVSGNDEIQKKKRRLLKREESEIETEFMKRFVFAFASVCFVLIGVPLGIRAQRKESSIGMAIAIVTALTYYLIIILMMSLAKVPSAHPEFFIWLPVACCIALASWLIPKNL
jgi:lipopolysaccharide export system permease protein